MRLATIFQVLVVAMSLTIAAAALLDIFGWSVPEVEVGREVWLWRAATYVLAVVLSSLLVWSTDKLAKK